MFESVFIIAESVHLRKKLFEGIMITVKEINFAY